MKPPAKLSPAPVGSTTSASGKAGITNDSSRPRNRAPCSPFLMMTKRGPSSSTFRPARTRLTSSVRSRASPSEGGATLLDHEARGVDAPRLEHLLVLAGEVLADHAHQADGREVAGGVGEVSGRPAQGVVHQAGRGFHRIQGDRADDEQGHFGIFL